MNASSSRTSLSLACLLALVWTAAPPCAGAVTLTVCASGCNYSNFQSAINAALPGDTILLRAGETFTGNFTLPDKGASTSYITIRSDASDANLPAAGQRIKPADAAFLPKIRSGNSASALTVDLRAHHYRLMFLEFQANDRGFGDLIRLGINGTSQNDLSLVPHDLILDRLYIHGDPLVGQKRCIALDSASTTIVNSYVAECKGVGQDAQAIGSVNGQGPFTIENNYLEGAGENVLFGGDDPKIPNLVGTGITFRHNYLSKPVAWRNDILPAPQPAASASASGGSLAAGTYFYTVEARATNKYQGNTYRSAGSVEVSATVASGSTGAVTLQWAAVPNATEYRVYGRASGAPTMTWTVTGTSFTDTGAAGTATTTGPPASGTTWLVKNVFELKNARDVVVYGNVMEYSWRNGQDGYILLFTPRNSGGNCPWCIVDNVEVSYNILRHGAGGVQILGENDDPSKPSERTQLIKLHDNLFYDINTNWGLSVRLFQIGHGPETVIIDHNTADHPNNAQFAFYASPMLVDLRITNNLLKHATYGVIGDGTSMGTPTLNGYATSWTFTANTLAGGSASLYPPGNLFPTAADWEAQFVDYANADFHLKSTSPYKNAGTDGKDLGADIDGILAATAGADLPAPWLSADIGAVGPAGSASSAGNTFTVEAGGTDIWDTADAFHYVYQPLTGDGEIVADVSALTVPSGAAWSLAGVMIREQLTANSVHATMMITTEGKAKFRRRATTGGTTLSDGPSAGTTYPPRWLKLVRSGNTFSAFLSSDGVSWTQVHTTQTIPMAATVYIGLVALRNGSTASTAQAIFQGVTVRTLPSPWQQADIGAVGAAGKANSSGGTFTIEGGGTDLWDIADAFHYVYQPLNGDGEIVADVTGLTVPAGSAWSLAAVMVREKLTADSIHASMMITTDGKAKFRRRTTERGTTASDGPSAGTTYPPRWLRLTRTGDVFTAYLSTDGVTWTQVFTPQTIPMASQSWIGLAVLRNGGSGTATATVQGVSVTP